MMFKMFKLLIILMLIPILNLQSVSVRSEDYLPNEQKVKETVADFNKILLVEMNPSKAFETHYYLLRVDGTDLKFGLNSFFVDATREINKKDKIRFFASDIYFEYGLPLIQMRLGKILVLENTRFVDTELIKDQELKTVLETTLAELGVSKETEDKIGNPNKDNIDFYESYSKKLNSGIAKHIDKKLLIKNVNFINGRMKITKEVFEGREYFSVENKLFHYKVAIKNGKPKIMYINRNYSE